MQGDRGTKRLFRFLELTELTLHGAKIVSCAKMVGLLGYSLAECVRRGIRVADVTQDCAVIVQKVGIVRSTFDRACNQSHAFLAATLMQEKPEEMLCGDVICLLCENSPVERLGIRQPA
jgi:hypothetical protein